MPPRPSAACSALERCLAGLQQQPAAVDEALAAALEAWRATREPRVADVIDRLSARRLAELDAGPRRAHTARREAQTAALRTQTSMQACWQLVQAEARGLREILHPHARMKLVGAWPRGDVKKRSEDLESALDPLASVSKAREHLVPRQRVLACRVLDGQCSRLALPRNTGHTSSAQSVMTVPTVAGSIVWTDFEW
jgi:hypothetical protein